MVDSTKTTQNEHHIYKNSCSDRGLGIYRFSIFFFRSPTDQKEVKKVCHHIQIKIKFLLGASAGAIYTKFIFTLNMKLNGIYIRFGFSITFNSLL